MTRKQYENLKIGDLVTKTSGPNKGILMKITIKYLGSGGIPCLKAEGIDEKTYIYHQQKRSRDGRHTCGSASCFKIVS